MASFQNLVITDAGLALMADLIEDEDSIQFAYVSIGDGSYSASEKTQSALKQRTSLKSQRQDYDVSKIEPTAANQVRLKTLLSNYDPESHTALFAEGFYVNELGVYARPASGGTAVLFAITVTTQAQGDYLPHFDGENPVEMVQDVLVFVKNDLQVDVTYSESAFALVADVVQSEFELVYGLVNSTATIRKDSGDTIVTRTDTDNSITAVTRIHKTSSTVTTVTCTVTPTAGDYQYIKTTVLEKVTGGTDITGSYERRLKS